VADVVGQELLPGAVADRVVGGEVAALVVAGEHRPGEVDRQHWPPPPSRTSWWNWVARRIVHGSPEAWISRSAWSLAW
jgi:hypothetical protein